MRFEHEHIDAWQAALEILKAAAALSAPDNPSAAGLPRRMLERAESAAAAIAHGQARRAFTERRHWFEVARGRAMECASTADALAAAGVIESREARRLKELAATINTRLREMIDPEHAAGASAFPLPDTPAEGLFRDEPIHIDDLEKDDDAR